MKKICIREGTDSGYQKYRNKISFIYFLHCLALYLQFQFPQSLLEGKIFATASYLKYHEIPHVWWGIFHGANILIYCTQCYPFPDLIFPIFAPFLRSIRVTTHFIIITIDMRFAFLSVFRFIRQIGRYCVVSFSYSDEILYSMPLHGIRYRNSNER